MNLFEQFFASAAFCRAPWRVQAERTLGDEGLALGASVARAWLRKARERRAEATGIERRKEAAVRIAGGMDAYDAEGAGSAW